MAVKIAETSEGLTWPLLGADCRALTNKPEEEQEHYWTMAVDFLWVWTGKQFGTQTISAHPERRYFRGTFPGSTFYGSGPYGTNSYAYTAPYRSRCITQRDSFLQLRQPLMVERITRKGEELPPDFYFLEGDKLYRTDGGQWSGNFEDYWITYLQGKEVPKGGQVAAGRLACEFALAAHSDPNCELPSRVQTITREGVTVAVMDEFNDLLDGKTGIWLIDSWVASVMDAPRSATVLSPESFKRRGCC